MVSTTTPTLLLKHDYCRQGLRSNKFNPDRKFQSWLEIFNLNRKLQSWLEMFNPVVFLFTGPSWCYRDGLDQNFQSTIDRSKFSILNARIDFFNPRAIWECSDVFPGIFEPLVCGSEKIPQNSRKISLQKSKITDELLQEHRQNLFNPENEEGSRNPWVMT